MSRTYRCAGASCPGLSWPAAAFPHPDSCNAAPAAGTEAASLLRRAAREEPSDATPAVDVGELRARAEAAERALVDYRAFAHDEAAEVAEAMAEIRSERDAARAERDMVRGDQQTDLEAHDAEVAKVASERDAAIMAASGATVRANATERLLVAARGEIARLEAERVRLLDLLREARGDTEPPEPDANAAPSTPEELAAAEAWSRGELSAIPGQAEAERREHPSVEPRTQCPGAGRCPYGCCP